MHTLIVKSRDKLVSEFGLDSDGRVKTPFVFWWDMRDYCGHVVQTYNRTETDIWIYFYILWDKKEFAYAIECFEELNEY